MPPPGFWLDKPYNVNDMGGIGAYLVVVQATGEGECRKPIYNGWRHAHPLHRVETPLGVTTHSQTLAGGPISVRKCGIARVMCTGRVTAGDALTWDIGGKVKAIDLDDRSAIRFHELRNSSRVMVVGFAETDGVDTVIEMFIQIHQQLICG